MIHPVKKRIRAVLQLSLALLATLFLASPSSAAFPGFGSKMPTSFADLANEVKSAVVNLSTTQVIKESPLHPFMGPDSPFREFFGDEFFKRFFGNQGDTELKTHALGSGLVISEEGYILTNNHVVEKASEIKVKLEDGKEYDAKVIGRDPKTDLALIRVTPDSDFPKPARLGDSDKIRVGDWVMAVGNPFGLGHTVTTGIISAKGRVIGAGPYDDFLQTDAAINPGNSGGPLFNMDGEVVGINTAIVAQGQGIGFAIPVNVATALLPQLKTGKIVRGWLGVMIQDITPELAQSFGLQNTTGVLVSDVLADSPAEKAGLKRGDVVLQFNGNNVLDANALSRAVAATAPESKIPMQIVRNGQQKNIDVEIGTMPDGEQGEPAKEGQTEETRWGITVQEVTPEIARHLGLEPQEKGVVISNVKGGSPAQEAGLQPGDLIKEINRKPVKNLKDYQEALETATRETGLLLLVKRSKGTFYAVLKPAND